MFFLAHGYRVVAHDRRGHGRSEPVSGGHDMDHYADDLAAVVEHLDLRDAIHVGHSTGGGEVVRYLARHGEGRAARAALIAAVPPLMVQTDGNPEVVPYKASGPKSAELLSGGTLKTYHGFPHGMPTTEHETINADLLAWLRS